MYRFIGEQWAYDFFNSWAFTIATLCCLFFIKTKLKAPSIYAKALNNVASRKSIKLGNVLFVLFSVIELYLCSRQVLSTPMLNGRFGDLVGTGVNYFGSLFGMIAAILALSIVLVIDPLKNFDISVMIAPIFLFIVKIACFCNGCCWGIPWEHGLFNRHPNHPGYQVPVQAFEAFCALAIFVFLLIYRKKAKPGRLFPMYMILYSATRFPIEFLSAAHEKVIGPFNTYHILCAIGVGIGLLLLLIVNLFGEKISNIFESVHNKLDEKMMLKAELNAQTIEEKNSQMEAERKERLEKAKKAREKASIKYKK